MYSTPVVIGEMSDSELLYLARDVLVPLLVFYSGLVCDDTQHLIDKFGQNIINNANEYGKNNTLYRGKILRNLYMDSDIVVDEITGQVVDLDVTYDNTNFKNFHQNALRYSIVYLRAVGQDKLTNMERSKNSRNINL